MVVRKRGWQILYAVADVRLQIRLKCHFHPSFQGAPAIALIVHSSDPCKDWEGTSRHSTEVQNHCMRCVLVEMELEKESS
jgi:hypothetical protein